jgi:hypothetical protein
MSLYGNPAAGAALFGQQATATPDPVNQQYPDYPSNQNVLLPAIPVHPNLHPHLQGIANYLVNTIQETKLQNNLRMFLFNQMAPNHFQNPEFTEFLNVTVDNILMQLETVTSDVQQAAQTVVPRIVAARAAGNLKLFPQLASYLTPEQQAPAQQAFALWTQAVMNTMQRQNTNRGGFAGGFGGQPAAGFGAQPPRPVPYGGGVGGVGQRGAMPSSGLFDSQQSQPPNFRQPSAPPAMDRYTRQLAQSQAEQAAQQAPRGVYAPAAQAPAPAPMNMQPFQARADVQTVLAADSHARSTVGRTGTVQVDSAGRAEIVNKMVEPPELLLSPKELQARGLKWSPSDVQPYHSSWRLSEQTLQYAVYKSGQILAVIQNQPPTNTDMDEIAHSLGGRIPTAPRLFVKEDDPIRVTSIKELPKIDVVDSQEQPFELSEITTLLNAGIEARLHNHLGKETSAYRVRSYVCEPLHCESPTVAGHYRGLCRQILRSPTFERAVEVLKGMRAPEEMQLRNRLNQRLTAKINEVLKLQMGLGEVVISDFTNDILELVKLLGDSMGANIAKALVNNQADILMSTCSLIDDEESLAFARTLADLDQVDAEQQPLPLSQEDMDALASIVFFGSRITVTMLGVASYQLDLALSGKEPLLLTEGVSPVLYAVVDSLFTNDKILDGNFHHHYLLTLDGVRIQVAPGYLNTKSYLMITSDWA